MITRMKPALLALSLVCASGTGLGAAETLSLALPVGCTLGTECFIQQYVDLDPGPASVDYRCGTATYDGHKGTDFRLKSLAQAARGVPVVASATGIVKSVRDGMEDRLIVSAGDLAVIADRECGNGVVIDHGDGWETQYCHLRQGSLMVHAGQGVMTGTQLGLVGYSGRAQFAHAHLSVRRNGVVVDPFLGLSARGVCQAQGAAMTSSLWAPEIQAALNYSDAAVIEAGFAGAPVTPESLEAGPALPPEAGSGALVFYVRMINLRAGDAMRLVVTGPGDFEASQSIPPLEREKAHYVAFIGKKRRGERWPPGQYAGKAEILRGGKVIAGPEALLKIP